MRTTTQAFILSILLTVTAPATAGAEPTCSQLFESKHLTYGSVDPEFKWDRDYTRELKTQSSIKDQCALANCHIQSWVAEMEHNYETEHGESIQLSTEFITLLTWLNKAVDLLHDSTKSTYVNLASDPLVSLEQIRRFGVMPADVWRPKIDVSKKENAGRLNEYIANIIARAKWDRKRTKDLEQRKQINASAEAEIHKVFNDLGGDFPDDFEFKGARYTTHSFFIRYFELMNAPVTTMRVKLKRKGPTTIIGDQESMAIMDTSVDDIESVAKQLIDLGENVYLGFEANQTFIDEKTGLMSLQAFIRPQNAEPLSRDQRKYFNVEDGGHAVQIVGYEVDDQGRVVKWKIKNSWGLKAGDQGYYHMHRDYFRTYVRQITFFNDRRLKLPEAVPAPPLPPKKSRAKNA